MKLSEMIGPCIATDLRARSRDEALIELLDVLEDNGRVDPDHRDPLLLALLKREATQSTGVGAGVAIPHAKTDLVRDFVGALGISRAGIPFGAIDKQAVHVVFLFLSPERAVSGHLKLMARIGGILKNPDFARMLREARRQVELEGILEDAERMILRGGETDAEV